MRLPQLLAAALLLVASFAVEASAGPADTALAVAVNGSVQVQAAGSDDAMAVTPFMKLREGDRLTLPEGGGVELVYLGSGRRESWSGPLALAVHAAGTQAGDTAPTKVSELGSQLAQGLEVVPVLLGRAERTRAGQSLIRGKASEEAELSEDERAEIDQARGLYAQLKKGAAKGDILPEMYLAGVLLEFGLSSEAARLLKKATRKCRGCEAPARLLKYAEGR